MAIDTKKNTHIVKSIDTFNVFFQDVVNKNKNKILKLYIYNLFITI